MPVDFNDYFWGDKNNGFDVLYHNMKDGWIASKNLADFLRERVTIEENSYKLLVKLSKQTEHCSKQGSFSPLWQVLTRSAERVAGCHFHMVQRTLNLIKEISKYSDELHKKHKSVKEDESGTLEAVQAMQSTTLMVQKAKDLYIQRGAEFEKLKKENNSPKDIEKAEIKLKKAHDDYKNFTEKYIAVKNDFESKMTNTCRHFQDLEDTHLKQMKQFLDTYAEVIDATLALMGNVHTDFKKLCMDLTVERLLEQFAESKCTGIEKPGIVLDIEETQLTSPVQEQEATKTSKREGFLRSRRDKAKQKKAKKKDNSDNQSNKEEKSDLEEKDENKKSQPLAEAESEGPELDEDGFAIQPEITSTWHTEKGNFYSSSDSDSEDDRERKIRVEIKPINNGGNQPMSASVDELRATVENLHLLPASGVLGRRGSALDHDSAMKRSQSVSQQLGGKPSTELLGLNFQSPTASNASTPTSSHPYAPLQSPSQPLHHSPTLSSNSKYADLGDLFSEVGEIQPSTTTAPKSRQTTTPTLGYMSIPRPPSRRSEATTRGHISPSTISRADSVGSLEFRTACVPVGASRGPSPLTIGMADTIPIAIAFHEIVHSFFRGADETRCQVKMSGDMMLSFPAGIVTALANNPNPAKLSFRVLNTQRIFDILPNKSLVSVYNCTTTEGAIIVEFNMTALSTLLKKQSEQNPTASYFNVDILKYHIKPKAGANSCPLQLVAYWKCVKAHTDIKVDYKYNLHALSSPSPLFGVTVVVPVDGGVKNIQSKPPAQWEPDSNHIVWKFPELSQYSDNHGVGSMLARFDVENGPTNPAIITAYFSCEGATSSGIGFQLLGSGYRVSLVKRRLVGGKYICDGDTTYSSSGTATPSSSTSVGNC